MNLLKLGAVTGLAALLATPAMAYISHDQIVHSMTGYGHGDGLAGFGPNGEHAFGAPAAIGSGTQNLVGNAAGDAWTWPVPLRRSGRATAMNMAPGFGVPHAVD
jgi:hypothetical protein